jgi:hypothetical protein
MKRNAILTATFGLFALVFGLAFARAAAAQDAAKVDGSWELTMKGPRGTIVETLMFQQDGNTLKGTAKGQRGESPLEGKVDGNKVHFSVHRTTPNGERIIEYNGMVDGDSMKGTAKFGENDREWTAARSKPAGQ